MVDTSPSSQPAKQTFGGREATFIGPKNGQPDGAPRYEIFLAENRARIVLTEIADGRFRIQPLDGISFKPLVLFSERYADPQQTLKELFDSLSKQTASPLAALNFQGGELFDFRRTATAESTLLLIKAVDNMRYSLARSHAHFTSEDRLEMFSSLIRLRDEVKNSYQRGWGKQMRNYIENDQWGEAGVDSVEDTFVHFTTYQEFTDLVLRTALGREDRSNGLYSVDAAEDLLESIGRPTLCAFLPEAFVAGVFKELENRRTNMSRMIVRNDLPDHLL